MRLTKNEVQLILKQVHDARSMMDPEGLVAAGVPQWLVDEVAEIYESNLDDPKHTIFDPWGRPVTQMRAVRGLDLICRVGRDVLGDDYDSGNSFGWQATMWYVKDRISEALGRAVAND